MKPSWKHLKPAFKSLRKKEMLVLTLSVVVLAATALAATVTPNGAPPANPVGIPTHDANHKTTTFTWLVVPQGNQQIKDFHIRIAGKKKPKGFTPQAQGFGWSGCSPTSGQNGDGADWAAGAQGSAITTANAPAGVPFMVTISDKKGQFTDLSKANMTVTVTVTSTGSIGVPSTTGTIVTTGSGGQLPVAYVEPEDKSIGYGVATLVALDSTEYEESYRVYALSTVTGCPDPWIEPEAFLAFAANHPVFDIGFANMTGTLDSEGAGAVTVNVPEMEELHGRRFFLVASVEEFEDGEPATVWSWPAHEYVVD